MMITIIVKSILNFDQDFIIWCEKLTVYSTFPWLFTADTFPSFLLKKKIIMMLLTETNKVINNIFKNKWRINNNIYWHANGNKKCYTIQRTEIQWIVLSSLPTSGACWIILFIYHFVYPQMCTHEFPQDQFLT